MGQVVRQRKYNLFWRAIQQSRGLFLADTYDDRKEGAIRLLLRVLTDDQLDEILTEIEEGQEGESGPSTVVELAQRTVTARIARTMREH